MRTTTFAPLLSAVGVALLVSSCSADVSAAEDAAESSAPENVQEVSAGEETHAEDLDVAERASVPLAQEHLAEGVEMPERLQEDHDIHVEQGSVLSEEELALFCPAEPAEDRGFRPSQQILGIGDAVEIQYPDGEEGAGVEVHHLHCEGEDALAEKAQHNGESQPVGWPQEWDGTGAMPDPYCHPDYLEIGEWEDLESFASTWEGIETSTIADHGQSQDEINKVPWEQSQARAIWSD